MKVLLMGGTDLTESVAEATTAMSDVELVGILQPPAQFEISYRPQGLVNTRFVDLSPLADRLGITHKVLGDGVSIPEYASSVSADVGLAVGWYHLLGRAVRESFSHGVLGVHASLLPDLRGGAPLPWAILVGRETTGVTLLKLTQEVDAGPVVDQRELPIGERATVTELVRDAEQLTLSMLRQSLPAFASGELEPRPQRGTPTYGLQRGPEDGGIDWRRPTVEIDRLVRAVTRPYPGAWTYLGHRRITIWQARPVYEPKVFGTPGQVARLDEYEYPGVVTSDGLLLIEDAVMDEGADALEFLRQSAHMRCTAGTTD